MPVASAARLAALINARPGELRAALAGFGLFFCLFAGYFMLRPIRESMGIQGGVENLQWLFTATFVAMLVAVPLFAAQLAGGAHPLHRLGVRLLLSQPAAVCRAVLRVA